MHYFRHLWQRGMVNFYKLQLFAIANGIRDRSQWGAVWNLYKSEGFTWAEGRRQLYQLMTKVKRQIAQIAELVNFFGDWWNLMAFLNTQFLNASAFPECFWHRVSYFEFGEIRADSLEVATLHIDERCQLLAVTEVKWHFEFFMVGKLDGLQVEKFFHRRR